MKQIFVYGSLREGLFNYDIYLKGHVDRIEEAYAKGKLYTLKDKRYPAFIPSDEAWVKGELMTLSEATEKEVMERMDAMEGYNGQGNIDNEYNRQELDIYDSSHKLIGRYELYVFNYLNPIRQKELGEYIEHGDFVRHINNK